MGRQYVVTNGIVPGAADSADIPSGITVTVDTNASIGFIYDWAGTLIMGTNSSLNVFSDEFDCNKHNPYRHQLREYRHLFMQPV